MIRPRPTGRPGNGLAYYVAGLCWLLSSCRTPETRFREVPASQSGVGFCNVVTETDSLNILTYPYAYNGGGVAVGDVDNDGRPDLFFTANRRGGNRLYLNRTERGGPLRFVDVTQRAGVAGRSDWCTGVTLTDVNADGWLDFYVCAVDGPGHARPGANTLRSQNALYVNQRNGTFREEAGRYGLAFRGHSTQAAFFDYDRDGDLDCFLLNHAVSLRDDYRDARARQQPDARAGSRLYENQHGHYVDVTQQRGLHPGATFGLGVAVGDLTGDGHPDLYVGNDFRENDFCYVNTADQRGRRFCDEGATRFAHHSRFSMGCDVVDVDNDGRLDVVTLDMLPADERVLKTSLGDDDADVYDYKRTFGFHHQVSRNTLQRNNGPGVAFSDLALQLGVAATDWSWCPLVADFTNDGRKDLIVTNGIRRRTNNLDFVRYVNQPNVVAQVGANTAPLNVVRHMPPGAVPDCAFEQTTDAAGQWTFTDRSVAWGFSRPTLSNGAAYADLDGDGDLDVVVNRLNEPAGLYENRSAPGQYLTIRLNGPAQNRFGIGATVWVWAGGTRQRYDVMPTRGFLSAVPPVVHIGLGPAPVADSLRVVWPDGRQQTLRHVVGRQPLVLHYVASLARPATDVAGLARPGLARPDTEFGPVTSAPAWSDVTDATGLHWTHHEDEFSDLAVNPLLPHRLSTEGPALAVGDVNGDGLDDCYVGGAKHQPGALFVQQPTGRFVPTNGALWAADAPYEDVDALFFDADGDRDVDLYVVSGGNEHIGTHPLLPDRLYRNNGRGQFSKGPPPPPLYDTKSCVRAADYDRDGDLDLFVGGRASARMYGRTPASALLRNNGQGQFTLVTDAGAPGLERVGMVTDARWTDVDRDGWPDLLLVGEWMPVTLFRNERGRLRRDPNPALANTHGLWTCMEPLSATTFVLGNWGLNSKLRASAEAPLRLYLPDLDQNGNDDPLLAVAKNGAYYPFLGKDELERRLPILRRQFPKYADFAGRHVVDLFGRGLTAGRQLSATTLASSLLRWEANGPLLTPLPAAVQTAPIRCGAVTGPGHYVVAGNFYGTTPYEGRYDALRPTLLRSENAAPTAFLPVEGAIRHARPMRLAGGGRGLLLARHNQSLRLLRATGVAPERSEHSLVNLSAVRRYVSKRSGHYVRETIFTY